MLITGSKERKIPYPTSNPMTQLFRFVSCPNYTYEVSLRHLKMLVTCLVTLLAGQAYNSKHRHPDCIEISGQNPEFRVVRHDAVIQIRIKLTQDWSQI